MIVKAGSYDHRAVPHRYVRVARGSKILLRQSLILLTTVNILPPASVSVQPPRERRVTCSRAASCLPDDVTSFERTPAQPLNSDACGSRMCSSAVMPSKRVVRVPLMAHGQRVWTTR